MDMFCKFLRGALVSCNCFLFFQCVFVGDFVKWNAVISSTLIFFKYM